MCNCSRRGVATQKAVAVTAICLPGPRHRRAAYTMAEHSAAYFVPPDASQLEKIFKEFNTNAAQLEKDTQSLKEWVHSQPHLPHDIENNMLTSFIVGSKNSLERSKQLLDTCLSNRSTYPDFYFNRDPCDPDFRHFAKYFQYLVLPGITAEGYRVSVFRMVSRDVDPACLDVRMNALKLLCSYDVRFLEDPLWAGDVCIIDAENITFKHLQMINFSIFKKYMHCATDSLPVRYEKTIFINISPALERFISLLKRLVKPKISQRIISTTDDYQYLYSHVPQHMLPAEYGGLAGTLDHLNDAWQRKLESYREWFLRDMGRRVDESKRPQRGGFRPEAEQLFGVHGSFKTLALD